MVKFDPKSGFDGVSRAGFHGYAVSIDTEFMRRVADLQRADVALEPDRMAAFHWHSANTIQLNSQLQSLFRLARQPSSNGLDNFADLLNDEIADLILGELQGPADRQRYIKQPHRTLVLGKVQEILNEIDELPITVNELCSRVGTSSSALHRLFHSEYGVSPKAYIRARCLSAVRDELAIAPPGSKIVNIANRWGFWHMGQFAKDFRSLFGELPSACLRPAPG
jgi:AraC-like DNA-binding protein